MERLYDKLKAYSESDFYAFHMPGHKRNKTLLGIELPYDLDITEIDGFDDLHHADGILKEEQERAARVFGAEESHFLVNGFVTIACHQNLISPVRTSHHCT